MDMKADKDHILILLSYRPDVEVATIAKEI